MGWGVESQRVQGGVTSIHASPKSRSHRSACRAHKKRLWRKTRAWTTRRARSLHFRCSQVGLAFVSRVIYARYVSRGLWGVRIGLASRALLLNRYMVTTMDIYRLRVSLGGSDIVGAGVTTFYSVTDASALQPAVATFFGDIRGLLPSALSYTVPNSGEVLDASTGATTSGWTAGGESASTGTGTGAFALGVGASIRWNTGLIENSRRVAGRTYVVPMIGSAFEDDGTLALATLNVLRSAATGLITAAGGDLAVWHRPGPLGAGVPAVVTSSTVKDTPSWLRSRRT